MSSIGTVATQCNESSNMDHLQQVLEFIENNTNKSNKRTLKEPPEANCSNRPLQSPTDEKGCKKNYCWNSDSCGEAVENGYQLTDIFSSKVSDGGKIAGVANFKCDRSGDAGQGVDVLQPEVVWV